MGRFAMNRTRRKVKGEFTDMRQFLVFFINGGVLGIIAWTLQMLFYTYIGSTSQLAYASAIVLTYIPMIAINCGIQRHMIFNAGGGEVNGQLLRFFCSNIIVMGIVVILSPLFRILIDNLIGRPYGEWLGFLIASILSSMPSFLLNKFWVFRH